MAIHDDGELGSPGMLSRPAVRIGLGVAVVLLGVPLLYAWGWTLDRYSTGRAISHAEDQGNKALEGNDPVRALIAFNYARELRPSSPSLQRNIWRARARFLAENADRVTLENLEQSRYEVAELLADDPKNAVFLVAQAHIDLKHGENADAGKNLTEAVKQDPKSVLAHLARAAFLQRTSDKADDVIAEFNAVLAVEPNNFAAHFGLGQMFYLKKDLQKEIDTYKKAIAVNPASYAAHQALGDAYRRVGSVEALGEAHKEYKKAALIQPNNPEPHWGLGIIERLANNWKEAEAELRMAMRGKRTPAMDFELAVVLARQNRCQEAMPFFAQFLREEPTNAGALIEIGTCAQALGQKESARVYYSKVLELPLPSADDPKRADAEKLNAAIRVRIAQLGAPAAAAPLRRR